jgi:iron complex outermembrane receptor protein
LFSGIIIICFASQTVSTELDNSNTFKLYSSSENLEDSSRSATSFDIILLSDRSIKNSRKEYSCVTLDLEKIVVKGKRNLTYTASQKNILAEDFQGKYQDVSSLLNTITGVNIYRTGGLGAYSSVKIRGSSSNQVQIFQDGIPLNTANGGAVDIGKIPLNSIQELTIHKSSAPLYLLGSNAGGIIELSSNTAKHTDNVSANAEIGSFGYRKAGAFITKNSNGINHRFSIDFTHSNNNYPYDWDMTAYRDGDAVEKTMDNQYFTSVNGLYGASIKLPGDHHLISSQLSFSHTDNGIFYYSTPDSNDGFVKTNSIIGNLTYLRSFGKLDIDIKLNGRMQDNLLQRKTQFYIGNARKREAEYPYGELVASAKYFLNDYIDVNALVAGEYLSYSEHDLWNVKLAEPYSRRLSGRGGVEANLNVSDLLQFNLKGVLRYEFDSTNGISFGFFEKKSGPKKTKSSFPSAEFDLLYNVSDIISFSGSLGSRSRSPGFDEKFASSELTSGNIDLRSETRTQYDVGLTFFTNSFNVAISGFGHYTKDKILFISNSQGIFVPRNISSVVGFGAELETEIALKWFSLSNQFTLMDNRVRSDSIPSWSGKSEPYLPLLQDFCSIEIHFWRIRLRHTALFSSGYYTAPDNLSFDFFKPNPELGLQLSLEKIGPLTFSYRLDNYLSEKAYAVTDNGKSVDVVSLYHENPKPGRMHVFTVNMVF